MCPVHSRIVGNPDDPGGSAYVAWADSNHVTWQHREQVVLDLKPIYKAVMADEFREVN